MKARFDKSRKELKLNPGDLVLLSTRSHQIYAANRKHSQRYAGPYFVQAKINDNAYKLTGLPTGVPSTQNVKFLVLFKPNPEKFALRPMSANPPDIIDGSPHWEVNKILDDKSTRSSFYYMVQWAGTLQKQWLPLRCLTHCGELLKDYYNRNCLTIPPEVTAFLENNASSNSDDDQDLPDFDDNLELLDSNDS